MNLFYQDRPESRQLSSELASARRFVPRTWNLVAFKSSVAKHIERAYPALYKYPTPIADYDTTIKELARTAKAGERQTLTFGANNRLRTVLAPTP